MFEESADRRKVPASQRDEATGYDEDVFRYLLENERARAERANRPLRLLLATLEPSPGEAAPIPSSSATKLFKALKAGLRETDVTGWYSQQRIVAAVLSGGREPPDLDPSPVIEERVAGDLRLQLPPRVARSLKVRVIEVLPRHAINE